MAKRKFEQLRIFNPTVSERFIIRHESYSSVKHHIVWIEDSKVVYKCGTWSPQVLGDRDRYIISKDSDIVEISERQLCYNCFGRPKIPVIKVNASEGRISN